MRKDEIVIPKRWFYIGIAILVIIAFALILGNYKVKFGDLELSPVNTSKQTDTVVPKAQAPSVQSQEPPMPATPKVNTKRKTSVKSEDTMVIVENQPANINTGQNNGIIGNGNTINVQTKEPQRHLDDGRKVELLNLINQVLKQNNKDIDCCVRVSTVNGTPEAEAFANEILEFLKANKYNTKGGLGFMMRSPTVTNVRIGFEQGCVAVLVGKKE